MPLDPDLKQFFVDTVDIYRPGSGRVNADGMDEESGMELESASVSCLWDPKGEGASASPIGRMNRDNQLTVDVFYFADDGPDISDGWVIQIRTVGHPEYGTWLTAIGGRQSWTQMAGAFGVSFTRGLRPGVSAP